MEQTNAAPQVRREWEDAHSIMSNLADMYRMSYRPGRELPRSSYDEYGRSDRDYNPNDRGSRGSWGRGGELTWQGTVDGSDLISIRGDRVWIDHLEAQPIRNASFDFTSPL